MQPMIEDRGVIATGTYKLSYRPQWQQILLNLKFAIRSTNPDNPSTPSIRSHCTLYKRETMDELSLGFIFDQTAGRELFFTMLSKGYTLKLLPVRKIR